MSTSSCIFSNFVGHVAQTTVGQRNYSMTSVTVLYELPLVAVLSITGYNNAIGNV